VWVVRRTGRVSREPRADSKHKAFDLGVRGCALRCLTVELPTQRSVLAAVSQTQWSRGGERERGEEG